MKRLAGKVAVTTGAGRPGGLGAAIARRLAEDGARIVISDIGQVVDEATPLEMIGAAEDIAQVAAELKACGPLIFQSSAPRGCRRHVACLERGRLE